ncbi:MAG: FAD-dependent oxidoreductase [Myxococcales bacterium]|nr:FAD-dependent oxidoreductase [Myxococcales bacterium]
MPLSDAGRASRSDRVASVRAELAALDGPALEQARLVRDPGSYNLVVHYLPPEVARDHDATPLLQARLQEPTGPVGLYLHVAPCTGRCTFCHYAIEVNPTEERLDRYLRALEREMTVRWAGGRVGPVRSVLVGGGTPTYLSAPQLDRLLTHLRATIDLPAGIEITVESAPETLTPAKLAVLRAHGVDRLNVGIQSFDDPLLRVLGRRHDGDQAAAAVEMAHAAGFPHVNIDLIYALPGQSLDVWLDSVERAIGLGVASLTTYHLRKRPDTRISRRPSPGADENLAMHLAAIRTLVDAGYRHSLADYFCRSDLETAQVQARDKWRDMQPVDGCGMEACSRRPDVVAFNLPDLDGYCAAIEAHDGWAISHGRALLAPEQMAQRAMFALKVLDADGGIQREAFAREFCVSLEDAFGSTVAELAALGVVGDDGRCVRLTQTGALFADEVCQRFQVGDLGKKIRARVKVESRGAPVPLPRARRSELHAAVAVVGAGAAGLAVAAELARDLGAGVIVFEAEVESGHGATVASLGGFRFQHDDEVLAQLSAAAWPGLQALHAEADLALRQDGYLFLATAPGDDAGLARQVAHAAAVGHAPLLLTAAEVARRWPALYTGDVRCAAWGAGEGHLDPARLLTALRRRTLQHHGRIETDAKVTDLAVAGGRVVGVKTRAATFFAETVVLAAGAGSADLLARAGVHLPLQTDRRHVQRVDAPGLWPADGPLVLTWSPRLYFRGDASGLVLSTWESIAPDDTGLSLVARVRERALQRLPGLANVGVRPGWSGAIVRTPDGRPLVGPCPGLDGLVLAAGLGGSGVMHSMAIGRLAAHWVQGDQGANPVLRAALDPRRLTLKPPADRAPPPAPPP